MKIIYPGLLGCFCLLLLTRCSTSFDSVGYLLGEGQLELHLAAVTGLPLSTGERLVVTVADLRLDGVSLPGFRRKTLSWGAGSQDATALYSGELAPGEYHLIELVLDPGTDDRGSGPGCYVLTQGGTRESLQLAAGGVLQVPTSALTVARNEYVRGRLTLDLDQALRLDASAAEGQRYELLDNRWNRRWASYATQDPQQVALQQQEVGDAGSPILE